MRLKMQDKKTIYNTHQIRVHKIQEQDAGNKNDDTRYII